MFDVSLRTTFNKQKRACAYDFPLAAFSRGGRPPDRERSERSGDTVEESDEKQRIDAVPDHEPDSLGQTETWGTPQSKPEPQTSNETVEETGQAASENGADDELRVHLRHAIDSLEEGKRAL